jgi:hypothetical protein
MELFEQWDLNKDERAALKRALDLIWSRAWKREEAAVLLRMRDALALEGSTVQVVHPYLETASTPEAPFAGPSGDEVRAKTDNPPSL